MRKLLWILGGIVLVSAAFFLPGGPEYFWQSLLFSGVAVFVFLIAFIFSQPKKSRTTVAAVCITLLALFGVYGVLGYNNVKMQKNNLTKIRSTIETGIAKNHINKMLLHTLRSYYSNESDQSNLGAIFQTKYDSLITGRVINYAPKSSEGSLSIELAKATADSVVLVAYSSFVPGRNTNFKNFSDSSGLVQSRGTLTKEGIEYEREN